MKITKSAACISIVLMLSGCTAILWGENKVTDIHSVNVMQIQDNVTDIFQYKNLAASVVQGKTNIPLNIPSEGVAFLGEKNIYILTRGADELLSLNKVTASLPLISGREENTLKLQLADPEKGDAVVHFTDSLQVTINKNTNNLSPEDLNIINQLGFYKSDGKYCKDVDIDGVIIPRESFSYSFFKTESLGRKYRIEFYSRGLKNDFHPINFVTNVVFTPVTLAADIVFFPISISFLRAIGNASAFSH